MVLSRGFGHPGAGAKLFGPNQAVCSFFFPKSSLPGVDWLFFFFPDSALQGFDWPRPSGMNLQQDRMAAVGTDKELSDLLDFSAVRPRTGRRSGVTGLFGGGVMTPSFTH